jgi:hypothetical protein
VAGSPRRLSDLQEVAASFHRSKWERAGGLIHLNLEPKSDYRRYPGSHEEASGLHLFGLILAEASRLEANDPTRLGASFTIHNCGPP